VVWLKFAVCVGLILFAGSKAARYGDIIAEKTRLGRIWIGALLLAVVTSMPELVTSISSVAIVQDVDMAVGTLVGTCIFNLFILVILDILFRSQPVLTFASVRHARLIIVGVIMTAVIAGGIYLSGKFTNVNLGWVSLPSFLLLGFYLLAMWRLSKRENEGHKTADVDLQYANINLRNIIWKFLLTALLIIGAGVWLSYVGEEIAEVTGWGGSFVGSLLLAITTSLPEITVAIAALRMGAVDLSVADILGANLLDLAYIFILDILYRPGPLLASISQATIILLGLLVAMYAVVLIALKYKTATKSFRFVSWYVPVLVVLYVAGSYLLFIFQ